MNNRSRTRRDFLKSTAALAAGAALAGIGQAHPARQDSRSAKAPTTVLIMGGTGFLGPQVVAAAKAAGMTLTLFNRGKTHAGMFPDIEQIHGDRRKDLAGLKGRKWDAVVDDCAYFPKDVTSLLEVVGANIGHYTVVSSISVYPTLETEDADETTAVGKLDDPAASKITVTTYGPLKALCEEAGEKLMPGRTARVRPGLIVGPGDDTDRFSYWPVRIKQGGEVLCPGSPKDGIQYIDVRDLGEWIVRLVRDRTTGIFNALGPVKPLPIGDLIKACIDVTKSDAKPVWADTKFLEDQKVSAWGDMPVWIPAPAGKDRPPICSNARAVKAGLTFRDAAATVKDTLAWWATLPKERTLKAGISRDRETAVLAAWHKLHDSK